MDSFYNKIDNYEKYTKRQLAENAFKTSEKIFEMVTAIKVLDDAEKDYNYYRGVIRGCKDSEAIYNKCKVKIKEMCLEIEDYEKFFDNECLREE